MTDDAALARLARQYSREAIATLVFAIRNSADPRVRVTAALSLLDRGFGRPAPAKPPRPEYSLEDVEGMIAELERRLPDQPGEPEPATRLASDGEAVPDAGARVPAAAVAEAGPHASENPRLALGRPE